jgi:hypothetical protein
MNKEPLTAEQYKEIKEAANNWFANEYDNHTPAAAWERAIQWWESFKEPDTSGSHHELDLDLVRENGMDVEADNKMIRQLRGEREPAAAPQVEGEKDKGEEEYDRLYLQPLVERIKELEWTIAEKDKQIQSLQTDKMEHKHPKDHNAEDTDMVKGKARLRQKVRQFKKQQKLASQYVKLLYMFTDFIYE